MAIRVWLAIRCHTRMVAVWQAAIRTAFWASQKNTLFGQKHTKTNPLYNTPKQKIKAVATCYNLTKNVAFVRAVALDENEEKPVAMAAGAFVTGG